MNKTELIRTLAAHAADAVVLLEKIWPDDDTFPAKLCDRADASDYFITNRGAVTCAYLSLLSRSVRSAFRPLMCMCAGKS